MTRSAIAVASLLTFPAWLVTLAEAATGDLSLGGLEIDRRTVVAMSVAIVPVVVSVILIMLWPSRRSMLGVVFIALIGLLLTSAYLHRYPATELTLFLVGIAAFVLILVLGSSSLIRRRAPDRGGPVA